jgi:hypothetical protein
VPFGSAAPSVRSVVLGSLLNPHTGPDLDSGLPMVIREFPLLGMVVTFSSPGVVCGFLGFYLSRVLPGKTSVEKGA